MQDESFKIYERLLREKSGLSLSREKTYLLESRLSGVLRKWEIEDLDQLALKTIDQDNADIIRDVVEAMATNETSFFRDIRPFDNIRDHVLPYYLEKRKDVKRIRIWSNACSSGQEPYSLAMMLSEQGEALKDWDIRIHATDISEQILERAMDGEYTQFEVQRGLPVQLLVKYFMQDGSKWRINSAIRDMVTFAPMNLVGDFSSVGNFDIILCRNVLIYFDRDTKKKVLENLARHLPPDGVLLLGGTETVMGLSEDFMPLKDVRGVYVKKDGGFEVLKKDDEGAGG